MTDIIRGLGMLLTGKGKAKSAEQVMAAYDTDDKNGKLSHKEIKNHWGGARMLGDVVEKGSLSNMDRQKIKDAIETYEDRNEFDHRVFKLKECKSNMKVSGTIASALFLGSWLLSGSLMGPAVLGGIGLYALYTFSKSRANIAAALEE